MYLSVGLSGKNSSLSSLMSTREYFDITSMAKSFIEEMNRYCLENLWSFLNEFGHTDTSDVKTKLLIQ